MAKRDADDRPEEEQGKRTKHDHEDVIDQRFLVENAESSIVIGRGGANVKNIRTETGTFVSFQKNDQGQSQGGPIAKNQERIMQIKGPLENIAKAIHMIAQLLIDDRNQRKGTQEETYQFKLLVHQYHAGCIIGKAGSVIKEIQSETSARINLSNEPLAGSTEKTVTITGTPDTIHAALLRVLHQIKNNPLKSSSSSVLYVPGGGGGPFSPSGPQYGAPQHHQYPPMTGGGYPGQPLHQQSLMPPQSAGAGGAGGPQKTQAIAIPTECAGTVIGKGGFIISDIKAQTGTQITIAPPTTENPGERIITVIGSAQGIQGAIYLIRQRVESYTPKGTPPLY